MEMDLTLWGGLRPLLGHRGETDESNKGEKWEDLQSALTSKDSTKGMEQVGKEIYLTRDRESKDRFVVEKTTYTHTHAHNCDIERHMSSRSSYFLHAGDIKWDTVVHVQDCAMRHAECRNRLPEEECRGLG